MEDFFITEDAPQPSQPIYTPPHDASEHFEFTATTSYSAGTICAN